MRNAGQDLDAAGTFALEPLLGVAKAFPADLMRMSRLDTSSGVPSVASVAICGGGQPSLFE